MISAKPIIVTILGHMVIILYKIISVPSLLTIWSELGALVYIIFFIYGLVHISQTPLSMLKSPSEVVRFPMLNVMAMVMINLAGSGAVALGMDDNEVFELVLLGSSIVNFFLLTENAMNASSIFIVAVKQAF